MNTNLYASLAALAPLDPFEQDQAEQLSQFSKMLTSLSTTNSTINLCPEMNGSGKNLTAHRGDAIPFDSPLDQSLGSPASTRDFQESPLQDLEFDFTATAADAPLFPDHGTQQQHHNDNMLASLPLFGAEFSFSQQSISAPVVELKESVTSSQNSQNNGNDFSFDAMARNMLSDMDNGRLNILSSQPRSASPSSQSVVSTASPNSSQEQAGITQLAAIFVREYARSHAVHDIDVLLRALKVAGINVSDEVVAEILASASPFSNVSPKCSPSPSPSPSPMVLPQAVTKADISVKKTRSSVSKTRPSIQKSRSATSKNFVCDICHKTFDRAFNLRTHGITHLAAEDREKPYTCPWSECNKPFMRKYDAERHYNSVHVKRGEIAKTKEITKAFSGDYGIPAPSAIAALFGDSDITQANG